MMLADGVELNTGFIKKGACGLTTNQNVGKRKQVLFELVEDVSTSSFYLVKINGDYNFEVFVFEGVVEILVFPFKSLLL